MGAQTQQVTTSAPRLAQAIAVALLGFAFARTLWTQVTWITAGGDAWGSGDWLINYAGGFVRRGLVGEILLGLVPPGRTVIWVLGAFQVALLVPLFIHAFAALRRAGWSWYGLALAAGPAGVAFYGWAPGAAFHKELLAFDALLLLTWSSRCDRARRAMAFALASLVAFLFAAFSWEVTVCLLPAFVYVLWRRRRAFSLAVTVAFIVTGSVALVLSGLFHGDAFVVSRVCDRIQEQQLSPTLCTGAVDALARTVSYQLTVVTSLFPVLLGQIVFLLLGLVPALVSQWTRHNLVWTILIVFPLLLLFPIGQDWGRWTSMIVIAVTICMTASKEPVQSLVDWNRLLAIAYATLWGINVFAARPIDYFAGFPRAAWRTLVGILERLVS